MISRRPNYYYDTDDVSNYNSYVERNRKSVTTNPEVTFNRNVEKSFTDLISVTKTHTGNQVDNKMIFCPVFDTGASVLRGIDLFIEDGDIYSTFEYINIFLEKNDDNTFAVLPQKIFIGSHNKLFIKEMSSIVWKHHCIDYSSLHFDPTLNSQDDTYEYPQLHTNIVMIPFINKSISLQYLDLAKYHIVIEVISNTNFDNKTIKLLTVSNKSLDPPEITRLAASANLAHHVPKFDVYDVNVGENKIQLNYDKNDTTLLFFNFTDNNKIEGELNIGDQRIEKIEINDIVSRLKHNIYANFKVGTYVVDPNQNIITLSWGGSQTSGIINFGENSSFIFNSEKKCKLYLTRVTRRVIMYRDGNDMPRMTRKTIDIPYFIHHEDDIETINAISEHINNIQPEPELEPQPEPEPEPESRLERQLFTLDDIGNIIRDGGLGGSTELMGSDYNDYNDYINLDDVQLYGSLLDQYEKSIAIPSYEKLTCVISLEDIGVGEYFYRCSQCNQPASYVPLKKWLHKNKSCPHCRKHIIHYPTLYVKKNTFINKLKNMLYSSVKNIVSGVSSSLLPTTEEAENIEEVENNEEIQNTVDLDLDLD